MPPRRPPRRGGPGSTRPHEKPTSNRPPAPKRTPDSEGPPAHSDRLQKALAHAGIGSRRACEELILQGRVTVDGKVVRELGTKVDPAHSQIAVDGQKIRVERPVYYAVNKPKGYVSTNHDPSGRPRVIDLLPEIPQRVYTVGRLDEMSTGLMLLTNDGELANRLAHPKFGVEKLYRAVVAGTPDREVLNKLTEGVWLAEGKVRAKRVRIVGKKGEASVLEMVLAEGKNREVRRMLAKLGHKVMTLTRTAVGPITLKGLAPGGYRPLSGQEVDLLRKVAAGIAVVPARGAERRPKRSGGRPSAAPKPDRPAPPPPSGGARKHARAQGSAQRPGPGPGKPPRPVGNGPRDRRPPRPEGPPPSQRRPAGPVEPQPTPRRDTSPPTGRRIIGLNLEHEGAGPRRPKPKARRKPPRFGLGRSRKPQPDES